MKILFCNLDVANEKGWDGNWDEEKERKENRIKERGDGNGSK